MLSGGILDTAEQGELKERQRKAERVVNVGLSFNFVLAVTKLLAGILGHSQALLADGINSVSDVVYFIVVKIFVRLSGTPADQEHPYGHYQFESVAALVVGAFVITTGIAIFWDSANKVFDLITGKAESLPVRAFALWVAVTTIVVKIFLMIQAGNIARETNNLAVKALAHDHRNDIFSSLGAAIGILFGILGVLWFDSVVGAIVAVVVMKTGFNILREASSDLMDSVPSEELSKQIKILLAQVKGIESVEEVHAHRFGPYIVANVTIGVNGDMRVSMGDQIANEIENLLTGKIDLLRKVYVHYHPARQL